PKQGWRCGCRSCRGAESKSRASARRPGHPTAGQHVQVDVEHQLSGVSVAVDHQSVSALSLPPLPGHLGRGDEKVTDSFRLGRSELVDRIDVLEGDEQQMRGRLRVNVLERQAPLVPVNDLRGNLSVSNLAE